MVRPLRVEFPGAVYHLTARGDRKERIFLDDDDRRVFLGRLGKEVNQQRWRCHAYCLMGNHYHLLVETPEPNLVKGMRRLNGVYTQAFNRRHGLVGHVFQGRYKSILVEKESHLLELCRYIVLNPIRAGTARSPEDWVWSSYRATAGIETAPEWLETEWILSRFGSEESSPREAYRRFVDRGRGTRSPWNSLRGQIFLGGEAFLDRMQTLVKERPDVGIPRTQLEPKRPTEKDVIGHVSSAYKVPMSEVLYKEHYGAFLAGIYLLRRVANLALKDVAAMAGVSPSRVSQIQRQIENGDLGEDSILLVLLSHYKLKA